MSSVHYIFTFAACKKARLFITDFVTPPPRCLIHVIDDARDTVCYATTFKAMPHDIGATMLDED